MTAVSGSSWWDELEHTFEVGVRWPQNGLDPTSTERDVAALLQGRLVRLLNDVLPGRLDARLALRWDDRLQISLDGTRVRLPALHLADDVHDLSELLSRVDHAVFADRVSLVTPTYAARVLTALGGQGVSLPPPLAEPEALTATLRDAVARGLAIPSAIEQLLAADATDGDVITLLEAAFDRLYPGTLRVALSRHQYDVVLGSRDGEAPEAGAERLGDAVTALREELFYELGVRVPVVEFAVAPTLDRDEFRLYVNDLACPPLRGTADSLKSVDHLLLSLRQLLRDNAATLLSRSRLEYALGTLAELHPVAVTRLVARYPTALLTVVLRSLLAEGIPIRDLPTLMEAMLAGRRPAPIDQGRYIVFRPPESGSVLVEPDREGESLHTDDLLLLARTAMHSRISFMYTRGSGTLGVLLMDPDVEELVGTRRGALKEHEHDALVAGIAEEASSYGSSLHAILTTDPVRPLLRRLIEREFPSLPVVGYGELDPTLNIQPYARVSLD